MELLIGLAIGLWWAHHRSKKKQRALVIIPVVFEGGFAYWLADGTLARSPAKGMNADLARTRRVDCGGDLPSARAVEIFEALEDAERVGSGNALREIP
jgi:hypothetical protein